NTNATGTDPDVWRDGDMDLDRRTRSQKQLDGIIGAVKAALTTNTLPTTGGNRPQIIATINYQDLFPHTHTATVTASNTGSNPTPDPSPGAGTVCSTANDTCPGAGAGYGPETGTGAPPTGTGTTATGTGTGNFVFTGPVAATTLRKIACDADIIPALLGTHGEILDLGRKTRLFTPAQRTALTARDQGCTFPNCTIPAPWCEAHHITYWSHDGPTTTENGALLCTHHHHLIHKEQWTITTQNGVPWYTPPRHIDPTQKPQQNHYFKPPPPPRE
ncbi:HNH endonuclease signature motif containing protein, partial [Arthrobacter sp. B6]|uniref:HNH endonuclease signature motif containing protein n=1 Tax=Arthrobacter sp. B6 TaxID=1570137 RepID=UPI0012E8458D